MSSSSDDDDSSEAAFKPRLSHVAEWFTDRNLSYTPRLERALLSSDYGITSLEEMKVIEISEWQSLLRDGAFPGEQYSMVKWRVFEKEFRKLTAEEFDATKAKPIPIKDTGDAAAEVEGGSSKASKRKKRNSGGNQGPAPIKNFFSATSIPAWTIRFDEKVVVYEKGRKKGYDEDLDIIEMEDALELYDREGKQLEKKRKREKTNTTTTTTGAATKRKRGGADVAARRRKARAAAT